MFSARLQILRSLRLQLLYLMVVVLSISTGCGGPDTTSQLSGEVTLDGQPLPEDARASITFRPARGTEGKPVNVEIVRSHYKCPSVPTGDIVAEISITIPTGETYYSDRTGQEVEKLENVQLAPEQEDGIELTVTGDETVNFDLHRNKG